MEHCTILGYEFTKLMDTCQHFGLIVTFSFEEGKTQLHIKNRYGYNVFLSSDTHSVGTISKAYDAVRDYSHT